MNVDLSGKHMVVDRLLIETENPFDAEIAIRDRSRWLSPAT